MATLENIQAKIARLQAEAEAIMKKQSSAVAKIGELMEKYGLTLADLESHLGDSRRRRRGVQGNALSKPAGAAKYLDPKSGATWTGHGRAPGWIANARDRSKFLISGDAQQSTPTDENVIRKGKYVRGPQAPKYQDPKTGATWSGRGRAPAWLADAKDRTAFLISGNGGAAPKAATAKKAAIEKQAVKRTGVKKATTRKTIAAKKVDVATDAPI